MGLLLGLTACGDCSDSGDDDAAEDSGQADGSFAGMGGNAGTAGDRGDPDASLDGAAGDGATVGDADVIEDSGPSSMDASNGDAGDGDASSGDAGDGDASSGDAGDGDASSGDAADGDASSDAGPDAHAEPDPDAATGLSLYVDPDAGSDTNPGTVAMPLKTIAHAASLAGDGDTIWLLDGTYDSDTEPRFYGTDAAPCGFYSGIEVPAGVTVRAVNPGQALLIVNAPHGFCMTGGALIGLDMSRPSPGGGLVEISAGEVLIEGTLFTNTGTGGGGAEAAIHATGTARVTVRPGALSNLVGSPAYAYARAEDDSRIEIERGTIDGTSDTGTSGNSVLVAIGSSEIVLDGVTIRASTQPYLITLRGTSSVSLLNGTVLQGSSPSNNAIHILGTSTLAIEDATIEGFGSAIYASIYEATNPTIVATDAVIQNNVDGISFGGDTQPLIANLTFTRGKLSGNSQRGLASNVPGTYTFDGTEIADNGARGLDFWNVANLYTVKLRGASVSGNASSGVYVIGAAGSSLDLGTLAEPGRNTFTDNNTSSTSGEAGVRIALTDTLVHAVGNTWIADAQGADGQGEYSATGDGAVLEHMSGSGPNFAVNAGTLRVAENP